MVGAGLPKAKHKIVMEPPSATISAGCTVGGYNGITVLVSFFR